MFRYSFQFTFSGIILLFFRKSYLLTVIYRLGCIGYNIIVFRYITLNSRLSGILCNNLYFNCCGWPEVPRFTAANGCIAVDPKFVDAAHGDFRLQADSPCINRGENADWMTSTAVNPVTGKRIKVFDLAGGPRLYGANVDIGCYELWFPMGLLIKVQ